MTNKQVVAAFVASPPRAAKNGKRTLFVCIASNGDADIFSYGRHWRIAIRQGDTVRINTDKISHTTTAQTTLVRAASRRAGLTIIE